MGLLSPTTCLRLWHDFTLSLSEHLNAQGLPDFPDSSFVKDEVIIWFQDGVLNPNYLGCGEPEDVHGGHLLTGSLPLSTTFIRHQPIVDFLSVIGVAEIQKMIPAINPCADTISYAINGNVLRMPHFWNALVVKFGSEQEIPVIAYALLSFFSDKILWAQPNFLYFGQGMDSFTDEGRLVSLYTTSPNDSLFIRGRQDRLKHGAAIPGDAWVDTAWTLTKGDPRVRIGVVDGGFDYRHPDLGGGVGPTYRVKGAWNYNSPAAGNATYLPWSPGVINHGTGALSTIGAVTNNRIGVAGVCGGDSAITTGVSMYCFVATTSASVSNAVWEASADTRNSQTGTNKLWKCDILSFSISTSRSDSESTYGRDPQGYGLKDEIVRAIIAFRYQNGRMTFASMGNLTEEHRILDTDITFTGSPQDIDKEWIVAVGGTEAGEIENRYDYGMNLDVLGPVTMTQCSVKGSFYVSPTFEYAPFFATSLAAPIAAGVGGLLLSLHKQLTDPVTIRGDSIPDVLYPEDVEWLLKHSAEQHPASSRFNDSTGWGAVRGLRTLEKLLYPYILKHDSVRFSYEDFPSYEEDSMKVVFPGWTRDTTYQPYQGGDSIWYRVKRYRLTGHIALDKARLGLSNNTIERVWGRGGNPHTGFGNPYKLKKLPFRMPLYRVGYCAVAGDTAYSQDSCRVETFVYRIFFTRPDGQYDSLWIPHPPDSTWFTYSLLARVANVTYVDRSVPTGISCHLFPNPGNETVHVQFQTDPSGTVSIRIFDVLGREVAAPIRMFTDAGEHVHSIATQGLRSGVFFIRFQFAEHAPVVEKLVVRR